MQTPSSSRLVCNKPSNPNSSTNLNPKVRNHRCSKQRIKNLNLDDLSPPIVTTADQRTVAQFLQAPTEGYEDAIIVPSIIADNFELKRDHFYLKVPKRSEYFFPPSKTTNLRIEITNFQQRFDESFSEAWDRFKDLLRACPHHGFSELHQLDTFYNALNSKDQDSLNSAAGGNFFDKMPCECLAIIESKSKVRYSRNKPVVSKVSTTSSTSGVSPDVAELKDMVKALLLDKKSQNQSPALVKAVEESCVTCGGAHSYRNYPATNCNVYRNNIQEFVSQASAVNYNQEILAIPVTSPIFEPEIAPVSALKPNLKASIPYPSRRNDERNRKKANNQIEKFYQLFKDMSFEISFADALILMPKFASTLKALIGNKEKLSEMARTSLKEHCSAVLLKQLPKKLGDPCKFLIPCDFPDMAECLALADLGASINLMPFSVWKKQSLPDFTPTCITPELADCSISRPVGVAEDVYVKVGSFHFSADFVVMDFDADPRVPLILERSFLKTERDLIDVFKGDLTLRVAKEDITFNLDQTSRYFANYSDMTAKRINVINMACEEYSQKVLDVVPGVSQVKKSPYRLAPLEMQELPEQLQDKVLELLRKDKLYAKFTKSEEVKNWEKGIVKLRRVRAMSMTIQSSVKDKILATPSETSKLENAPAEMLRDLDQQMEKRAGKENVVPDALSRKERVPLVVSEMDETHASRVRWMIYLVVWKTLQKVLETRLDLSTVLHPQVDGQSERIIQTLEDIIREYVIYFGGSYHSSIQYAFSEAMYGRKCRSLVLWAGIRESSLTGLEDRIICDLNKTPDMFQEPPQNYPKCGNPVDGQYCQGCALLRKKFKEDLFTYCKENGILQCLLDTFESSNDNTNVVNAPQEPFVVKQDPAWETILEIEHALEDKHCQLEDILELFRRLHNDVQNIHEELVVYINTPSWDRPTIFYNDDDDEDCTIAIIPNLSTKEPDNSLSMGDGYLDTILTTELNELIKYSIENFVPIPSEYKGIPENMCDVPFHDNSPPLDVSKDQFEDFSDSNDDSTSIDDDSFSIDDIDLEVMEIVIPEEGGIDADILLTIKDDILREKFLNINLLIANIESLKDNPTPYSDFMTKSSSTSLNFLLEETNTFDNSLPESETFCFDLEEISSGSTTTHFDFSLYDSFIFDLLINPFPPADRSDFYHEEFADELAHIISPPEYDCFCFKNKPSSGDFTMDVVEDTFPTREPRVHVHNVLPTHPTLQLNMDFILSSESFFAYVVWIFLPFLSYSLAPHYLLSFGNEDTIFDPGISSYHISSFMTDVSTRSGTFMKFNVYLKHLNGSPMEILFSTCSPMDQ
uniref:Reverse transcriptase domain-containing protein n=1 Tax=Tanacetum cinerariifolium TaxID=118510 RepID=A0A6L2KYY0_TANCI|nr:reverse transcriptase domain-containing protein [Tanacetum cinerariifolium]